MIHFSHSGRMGDVFYSLYFCKHVSGGEPFAFDLHTGVRAWGPSWRPYMMTESDAAFFSPLLHAQPYISEVTVSTGFRCAKFRSLDDFRDDMKRTQGREIREWYFDAAGIAPVSFDKPVLTIPDRPKPTHDRIAVCFTPRYRAALNPRALEPFRNKLVFVGLPTEHRAFCRDAFPVEYFPCVSMLEMLQFIASCRVFVGNVSGVFAAVECAKLPRILCTAPDGGNVRAYGQEGFEVRTGTELQKAVSYFL